MKTEILSFINRIKDIYKLEAFYFAPKDLYIIRFRGKGIQNFNSTQFYQIPKRLREKTIGNILRVGLNHNVGERHLKKSLSLSNIGKRI